jgi:hypothetical protein
LASVSKANLSVECFILLPKCPVTCTDTIEVSQEIYLTRNRCTIWYGDGGLDLQLNELSAVADVAPLLSLSPAKRILDLVDSELHAYRDTDWWQAYHWRNVTRFARDSLCYNDLDKVFDMQSMLDPECRIPVDYTQSKLDVYLAIVEQNYMRVEDITDTHFREGCWHLAKGMGIFSTDHDLYDLVPCVSSVERSTIDLQSREAPESWRDWNAFKTALLELFALVPKPGEDIDNELKQIQRTWANRIKPYSFVSRVWAEQA